MLKIKGATLKLEHELHEVAVRPGECLTVWARAAQQSCNVQVEIRVSPDGEVLIFCNEPVHPFSEWETLVAKE